MAVPIQKFREAVFQMLYSYDMGHSKEDNMIEMLSGELAITKKTAREAQARVQNILSHLQEIDAKITGTSKSYEFERIQSVERNILRLGVYEILFDETIPPKVAITEAMRLARKFSTTESATFVNAILDAVYKLSLGKQVDTKQIQQSGEDLAKSEERAFEVSQKPKELDKNKLYD